MDSHRGVVSSIRIMDSYHGLLPNIRPRTRNQNSYLGFVSGLVSWTRTQDSCHGVVSWKRIMDAYHGLVSWIRIRIRIMDSYAGIVSGFVSGFVVLIRILESYQHSSSESYHGFVRRNRIHILVQVSLVNRLLNSCWIRFMDSYHGVVSSILTQHSSH